MLSLSDIKTGKHLTLDGDPYTVTSHEHSKMGRAGAVLRTKLRNLANGAVIEKTFQGADKVEEAEITKSKAQYLYHERDNFYFMDNESYEQFSLNKEVLGNAINYLIEDTEVDILHYNGTPINIELPIKVTLTVVEAPPGYKGDTATAGTKIVTLETGTEISTPMFVNVDDKVIVNTQTGQYVSRA